MSNLVTKHNASISTLLTGGYDGELAWLCLPPDDVLPGAVEGAVIL